MKVTEGGGRLADLAGRVVGLVTPVLGAVSEPSLGDPSMITLGLDFFFAGSVGGRWSASRRGWPPCCGGRR